MYDGKRVVTVTHIGRVESAILAAPYLLKNQGLIDEHRYWADIQDPYALSQLHALACQHPEFIKVVRPKAPVAMTATGRHTQMCAFHDDCADPDTIYIRLADDICWLRDDAIEQLVAFRVRNPQYFAVYPATVNQGRTMYIHQVMGHLPEQLMPNWAGEYIDHLDLRRESPVLAKIIHESLLAKIQNNETSDMLFGRYQIPNYETIPVHAVSWLGEHLAGLGVPKVSLGKIVGHFPEEVWWSEIGPKLAGKTNCICGTSLVAHYAFCNQLDQLYKTDILARYTTLSNSVAEISLNKKNESDN